MIETESRCSICSRLILPAAHLLPEGIVLSSLCFFLDVLPVNCLSYYTVSPTKVKDHFSLIPVV